MLTLLLALQAGITQSGSSPIARASEASALVSRARSARYQQDSALGRYEAIARQRMSARIGLSRSLGLGPMTPERLAARFESVARVGWDYSLGAWGELIGARSVVPFLGLVTPQPEDEDVALVLPYHPGRDQLWPISQLRDALPNVEEWIEHPLASGADSLYLFSLGDSLRIKLPNGSSVRLREIRVRARRPASRLIVGSLWVDVASGSLVRAAYRPSVPIDLWPLMQRGLHSDERSVVQKFGPFTGIVREIIVEHGLYEGRFWLPRTRIASAEGTAKGGRASISIEQTFSYQRVSAVPASAVATAREEATIDVDPRTGRVRRPRWWGVQRRTRKCRATGDSTASRWSPDSLLRDDSLNVMYAEGVRFRVLLPCDRSTLVTSPTLPPSIYAAGEELFAETDFTALRADAERAIGFSEQAEWSPQRPALYYGLERGQLRYNRVEGLSIGVMADRVMGRGYTESGTVRVSAADRQVNGEVSLQRSNARTDVTGSLYRRLAAANEWENPLGLGASLSAALFGRDDGFYYRTLGAELSGTHRDAVEGPVVTWRIFAERQDSAPVRTQRSLANSLRGNRFVPNIAAREGLYTGASLGAGFAWGANPEGTRISGGARLEGATGETSYGRLASELAIVRGLASGIQGSLIGAAGTSVGTVPAQRLWYLGGAHTVRGHAPGAAVGDAFWYGRAELAIGHPLIRPSLFADAGWAGARSAWSDQERALTGAGVGASLLDGLVRLDAARGLDRGAGWRLDFYLEIR
jgi:hypothetical protein